MKDFYKATAYAEGKPSASVCLSTNIVSNDKLGMVTLRSGELNAHVHFTLDQMGELAHILNDAIDWWHTLPARKAAEEEKEQREAEEVMAEERATPRGEYDAQTVRVPAFISVASL